MPMLGPLMDTGDLPMPDRTRPERLQIMLDADELKAVDDWRFARRMPSRASAIRELLRRGLAVEGVHIATVGRHSASFGVVGNGQDGESTPSGNRAS